MARLSKKQKRKVSIIGGILLVAIWYIIFQIAKQSSYYYGYAILPAIVVGIILFILGCIFSPKIYQKLK